MSIAMHRDGDVQAITSFGYFIRSEKIRRLTEFFKGWVSRARPFAIAILMGLSVCLLRPTGFLDTIWSDLFLANQAIPATKEVVIVGVTSHDLLHHGLDKLNRIHFANTLSLLDAAGARRILFDITLGSEMLPEEEVLIAKVMSQIGPAKLATGYEPDPLLSTKESLLPYLTQVDLRLRADPDGRFRSLLPPVSSESSNAALWLATGQQQPGATDFDLRIAPESFQRFSLAELHDPSFDREQLRGKRVVISFDRTVSRSRANLPVHGLVDRALLIAMATQAQLDGYSSRIALANRIGMATGVSCLCIGFLIGLFAKSKSKAVVGMWALVVAVLFISIFCVLVIGARTQPATFLTVAVTGLYAALAHRLRLTELLAGFVSGNLSPEEVWLWRSKSDYAGPVILFDAVGGIKRANDLAIQCFGLDADSFSARTSSMAVLCMPGLGQRAQQLVPNAKDRRVWKLEWPHESLPLVQFSDITKNVERLEVLQRQLVTDPLTGVCNRAGFEEAIARLAESGRHDYGILYLDLNGFKQVNDEHGHDIGDRLLQMAAGRLASVAQAHDTFARIGGDEFALIVNRTVDETRLIQLRNKLEATLDGLINIEQFAVRVGVAVGFASPTRTDEPIANVLKRADAAMYERKAMLKKTPCDPSKELPVSVSEILCATETRTYSPS